MLFGHTYNIRAVIELEDGTQCKVSAPLEARFMSREEFIRVARNKIEQEIEWKTGVKVRRFLQFYNADE